jgi:hypothetical protein
MIIIIILVSGRLDTVLAVDDFSTLITNNPDIFILQLA